MSSLAATPDAGQDDLVLDVRGLSVEFESRSGEFVPAVTDVSWSVARGRTLVVLGESGSGKSICVRGVMRIVPGQGRITGGEVWLGDVSLTRASDRQMRQVRGRQIAMVFQDPQTSLNPCFRVGHQIAEMLQVHGKASRRTALERAVELLARVQIADPERRALQYPHELSGGMKQRVMIAMAISLDPAVLIADEPTTALDTTVQAQILRLLDDLQRDTGMAIVLITHDLGVAAAIADDVVVMYGGRVVEHGSARTVLTRPAHPYTAALIASTPRLDVAAKSLRPISGAPPIMSDLPTGCSFHPRCPRAEGRCRLERPLLLPVAADPGHRSACHFASDLEAARS